MLGFLLTLIILIIALYGYYISIKSSKLESEIRKNNLDYECFECKAKFSVNALKCPECSLITIYGARKKKFWLIIPIIITWLFVLSKFGSFGMISS